MSNIKIGLDSVGDLVFAAQLKSGQGHKAFYFRRGSSAKPNGFGCDEIAYSSIKQELTQEQIKEVLEAIREVLEK